MKKWIVYLLIATGLVGSFILVQYISYEANESGYPVYQFTREYFYMYKGRMKNDSIISIPDDCYKDTAFFISADSNHDREVIFEELQNEFKKADLDQDEIISDAEASKIRYEYGLPAFRER